MTDKQVRKEHDMFFKKYMSLPEVAKEFLSMHLPQDMQSRLDFNTVKVEEETKFNDDTLGDGEVDVLISAKYDGVIGYFYVIVEQQTKVDRLIAFRLHKYILMICDAHLKKCKENKTPQYLPLVYPIVLYTGHNKYNAPVNFFDLYEQKDRQEAKCFLMGDYNLVNLKDIAKIDFKNNIHAGAMEYMMKHIRDKNILGALKEVQPVLMELGRQNILYVQDIFEYTMHKCESDNETDVVNLFRDSVPKEEQGKIMTIAQKLEQKAENRGEQRGIEIGMQQGMQQVALGMLRENVSIDLIRRITGLSERELNELRCPA